MRLNSTDTVGCGSPKDIQGVPLALTPSSDLCRSGNIQGLIPVVDSHNNPLLPCKSSVADRLIKCGRATPFYKKSFFAIRINKVVENPTKKRIAVGIDPGSKRTGITVATEIDVILNIQCNTPDWVKKKVETKKMYRRSRRSRNTPHRKCRSNRNIGCIPQSTKARWQAHLRIINILRKILPITYIVIEDIKASTKKNAKKWNKNFSPLEVGKQWFENEIQKLGFNFNKFQGFDTYNHRNFRGFKKTSNKLSEKWEAHCVDSHCLVEMLFDSYLEPVKNIFILRFLMHYRRELHQGYRKGGKRRLYGSTRSMGLNRGTLVKHKKYGLTYVGGTSNNKISIHDLNNKRLSRHIKNIDCKILTNIQWITTFKGII